MHDIIDLSVELTVYRKGSLSVRLNLDQGIMVWQDSRQWCNNFVRSLSKEQIDEIRRVLTDSGLVAAIGEGGCDSPETAGRLSAEAAGHAGEKKADRKSSSLQLSLLLSDGPVRLSGECIDQAIRSILIGQIEKLSRVPFRL